MLLVCGLSAWTYQYSSLQVTACDVFIIITIHLCKVVRQYSWYLVVTWFWWRNRYAKYCILVWQKLYQQPSAVENGSQIYRSQLAASLKAFKPKDWAPLDYREKETSFLRCRPIQQPVIPERWDYSLYHTIGIPGKPFYFYILVMVII